VTRLEPKIRHILVPLGLGADFNYWGYPPEKITEADWYEGFSAGKLTVHLVPARHYSGRLLSQNKTLWTGFVLESPAHRVLFSGDTGYGPHFKEIAQRFGRFDLVALDMGQYDPRWPYIHMRPEEAAQAAQDLQTQALLPAHVGRFSLARHAWNEPFDRIRQASKGKSYRLLTPKIGEALFFDTALTQQFSPWWQEQAQESSTSLDTINVQ